MINIFIILFGITQFKQIMEEKNHCQLSCFVEHILVKRDVFTPETRLLSNEVKDLEL